MANSKYSTFPVKLLWAPKYTEADLLRASEAYQAGMTYKQAAEAYNVPKTVLYERINGR